MSNNTKTIARNAGWYGLENVISSGVTLFTSIAIARALGPAKMGYLIYVMWIASIVSNLGGVGIPATTSKYMAEFIGMGDRGTARYIYFRTLLLQMGLATIATVGNLVWVLQDANAEYRLASVLVVLSIWPMMVNTISAQANVASEELSTNLPASVISTLTYFVAIALTVWFGWGVVGVGASFFTMRALNLLIRFFPTAKRILQWETTHVQPEGLRRRMISFAWQSVASMVVGLIVWSRSEIFLLKHLCADIRQVAFYSVAFSLATQLLVGASIFSSAASTTIFAQYGRDKSRISDITASTFRYLALTTIPLHFISTALAAPALFLLYGTKYAGAAVAVTLAPILCMPTAFMAPIQSLLQSAERQSLVIMATVLAGIVDVAVAWYLIPAHGAVGAAIGSGTAQFLAMTLMWTIGISRYKVRLPWMQVAKITFISTVAALTAHYIAIQFAPLWGILCGGSAALIVLFGLMYLMRVLEQEDHNRFTILIGAMPKPIGKHVNPLLSLLFRPGFAGEMEKDDDAVEMSRE